MTHRSDVHLPGGRRLVMTRLDRLAWLSLRALVVGAAVLAVLWVAGRLRLVLLPVAAALLIAAPLRPVAARLERLMGRSGAAVAAVLGLVAVVLLAVGLAGRAIAADAAELREALDAGMTDVERWLADGPLQLELERIEDLRSQLGERVRDLAGGAARGVSLAAEMLAGTLLALVLAVFAIRDGDAFVELLARRSPARRAARLRLGSAAMWTGLRRYLLGAALLGIVEAAVIGAAVAFVGSPLAVPVAVFTFLAAFVPIVGAVAAGVVAVLAAFVGGGPTAAVVVAVVAIVVQQLDGDLLAPLIYGRATKLHPAAVLVAIATGTAVGGLAGAVLAVPLATVAVAVTRSTRDEEVRAAVDEAVEPAPVG